MARQRIVAVVGARALPDEWMPKVAAVVRHFLGRGWGIGSGGAGPWGPVLWPCPDLRGAGR